MKDKYCYGTNIPLPKDKPIFKEMVKDFTEVIKQNKSETLSLLSTYFKDYSYVCDEITNANLYDIPIFNIRIKVSIRSTYIYCTFMKGENATYGKYNFIDLEPSTIMQTIHDRIFKLLVNI